MEIKKFDIEGKIVIFVNESMNTRYGFKHVSHCFIDDIEVGENTVNYINRTWECYRYQTVMLGLINKLMDNVYNSKLRIYKDERGWVKMTTKRWEEFESYMSENKKLNLYKSIRKEIG